MDSTNPRQSEYEMKKKKNSQIQGVGVVDLVERWRGSCAWRLWTKVGRWRRLDGGSGMRRWCGLLRLDGEDRRWQRSSRGGEEQQQRCLTPGWWEAATARQGERKGDGARLTSRVDGRAARGSGVRSREVGGSHPGENGGIGFSSHAGWAPKCPYFGPGWNRNVGVRPRENSRNPPWIGPPKGALKENHFWTRKQKFPVLHCRVHSAGRLPCCNSLTPSRK
jgi:hypothetical protein